MAATGHQPAGNRPERRRLKSGSVCRAKSQRRARCSFRYAANPNTADRGGWVLCLHFHHPPRKRALHAAPAMGVAAAENEMEVQKMGELVWPLSLLGKKKISKRLRSSH